MVTSLHKKSRCLVVNNWCSCTTHIVSKAPYLSHLYKPWGKPERKLRKSTKETSLEGVLLIEGYDELILRENKTKIEDIINSSSTNLKSQKTQFYRLSYIQKK